MGKKAMDGKRRTKSTEPTEERLEAPVDEGTSNAASAALSRKMAEDFFERIKQIKDANPEASKIIDRNERQIQQALWNIRNALDMMAQEQRELVRILVIHGVSKSADDILLEEP